MAARTALAKELKADGRKDEAAAVAKLRRPSVAAWALNQVAREQPEAWWTTAIEAGEQLRAASDAAVAGRPGELRAATAAERTAANAVVKAAAAHLGARADATAPALLATIRVAALDEEVADQLRRGVLVTEQEQPGFGFGLDADRPALELVPDSSPKAKKAQATSTRRQAASRPRPSRRRRPPRPPSRPSGRRRRGRRSGKPQRAAQEGARRPPAHGAAQGARGRAPGQGGRRGRGRGRRPAPSPTKPVRTPTPPMRRSTAPTVTPSVCGWIRMRWWAHTEAVGSSSEGGAEGEAVAVGASRCRSRGGRRARRRSLGGW